MKDRLNNVIESIAKIYHIEHNRFPCPEEFAVALLDAGLVFKDELTLDEKNLSTIIKNYFGYTDFETPIYNISFGCNLSAVLTSKSSELIVRKEKKNDC